MSDTAATRKPEILSTGQQTPPGELQPGADIVDYVKEYAREKPEVAALWCLGIGFVLGWKLKPW